MQLLTQTLTKENLLANAGQVRAIKGTEARCQALQSHGLRVFWLIRVQHLVLHVHNDQDKKSWAQAGHQQGGLCEPLQGGLGQKEDKR